MLFDLNNMTDMKNPGKPFPLIPGFLQPPLSGIARASLADPNPGWRELRSRTRIRDGVSFARGPESGMVRALVADPNPGWLELRSRTRIRDGSGAGRLSARAGLMRDFYAGLRARLDGYAGLAGRTCCLPGQYANWLGREAPEKRKPSPSSSGQAIP